MTIELTETQCRALKKARRKPIQVVDPNTKAKYVLLEQPAYERLQKASPPELVDPSFFEFAEDA